MYGIVITEKGLELDAKLRAGGQLKLTRAMVGDGTVPEDTNPRKLTDLVSPFAEATSTVPVAVGSTTKMVVEYRNDMNGGLDRDRYINEYGLFAQGTDGEEILYLYGDLGEFREPVQAYSPDKPVITRRYPVSITVADGVDVSLGYLPSVFMTAAEAQALIDAHSKDGSAHHDIRDAINGLEDGLNQKMEATKQELFDTIDAAKMELDGKVAQSARPSYIMFEPEDFKGNELRIAPELHGLEPTTTACVCSIRQRVGRNVREITEDDAETVSAAIIDAIKDALDANKTTPETYPTDTDGHVQLTWEQVQYYLLENILIKSGEAESQATALGFGAWKNRDNGVAPSTNLDTLLTAAYLPAMGSPDTNFKVMCTLEVLQGLRFRLKASGVGYVPIDDQGLAAADGHGYAAKYDMDGTMRPTWGTLMTERYIDMDTKELILRTDEPYAGDVLVIG